MITAVQTEPAVGSDLLARLGHVLGCVEPEELATFCRLLLEKDRLFVMGAGRSGLVGRFFAMRMMHLGKDVYVVGETNTPSIQRDDLLIIVSGSAKSPSLKSAAAATLEQGASIALLTQYRPGDARELRGQAECCIAFERRSCPEERFYHRPIASGGPGSVGGSGFSLVPDPVRPYPMGSMFELSVLMFLESVVSSIILENRVTEEDMRARHTILE